MKTDIYTLAHEIKNPLCVVKGYLEMLNPNNFSKYKEIIQEELDTSLAILDEYLEFNKMSFSIENIDLNVFLLDVKKNMKDYLKKKNVYLDINLLDDEIYLDGDYLKLKQVFYNIIKNSVESTSKRISISYEVFYHCVNIIINNDGLKINENNLHKIGKNFSDKVLGHGIGTAISQKIISGHGGNIKYCNNEEKGVCVIITLPLS